MRRPSRIIGSWATQSCAPWRDEDGRLGRLGFAVQLCALRYPGRLLRPGELIPPAALAFLGGQLAIEAEALARFAACGPTRYEQLGTLRNLFGFAPLSRPDRAVLQVWLLPIALTPASGANVAHALMAEFRRRRIIIPGISIFERMAAEALLGANAMWRLPSPGW